MSALVAADQCSEVEVVARVHPNTRRKPAAERNLLLVVEQRDLDAVDFRSLRANDVGANVHRERVVRIVALGAQPVTGERGIEHLAQPMQDHRLADLR